MVEMIRNALSLKPMGLHGQRAVAGRGALTSGWRVGPRRAEGLKSPGEMSRTESGSQASTWLEHGQSLVELALVLPVMLLITLGCADFARLFSAEVRIVNAAREGARYGARFSYDTAGITQHVLAEVGQTGLGPGPNQITAITVQRLAAPNPPGGSEIRVTVSYQFSLVTPLPIGTRTLTLTSAAEMLVI